jgi:hypothetical protein
MAIEATMKPWLRYDRIKRVSTSDALSSPYLPPPKARTVSEAAFIKSRACIYKLEPARASIIIIKKESNRYELIFFRARH